MNPQTHIHGDNRCTELEEHELNPVGWEVLNIQAEYGLTIEEQTDMLYIIRREKPDVLRIAAWSIKRDLKLHERLLQLPHSSESWKL